MIGLLLIAAGASYALGFVWLAQKRRGDAYFGIVAHTAVLAVLMLAHAALAAAIWGGALAWIVHGEWRDRHPAA